MFKNKKSEFWFWLLLSMANVFTIVVGNKNNDETTCIIGGCVLIFCFAKALICAIEIDTDK